MGRTPFCSKQGLNIGAWTKKEDTILSEYIRIHGDSEWRTLPQRAGLKRCGKSCRLRWLNYLRPDIKRGNISPAEVDLIVRLHRLLGNRWSLIAGRLPGRTDNEIKNYWNTRLSKKLLPLNDSQPNSITQNLMPGSKFHSPKQNHAFKTTPVKTTPVRYSGMLRPNPTNGYGDCNCSSDEAAKLCNGKETTNSSKSWSDRVVKDSITHDCSEHTSFAMADVNLHETAAGNSSCSTWSLAEEKLLHYDHSFARDAPALAESLWELNGLSSPDCLTYFGLEEFYSEPVTLMAAGTNQFEYMRSDQSNAQTINSFTVADDQIMDEL